MLKHGSATAQGRMVAEQYLVTPNVIFSNPNAGGRGATAGLGGLIPGGALVSAVAGSMRVKEAQTALFVTDAQSGEQVAVSEGSAKATDFGGAGGLAGSAAASPGSGASAATATPPKASSSPRRCSTASTSWSARSRPPRPTCPAPRAASAPRAAPIPGSLAIPWRRSPRSWARRGMRSWPPIPASRTATRQKRFLKQGEVINTP